MTGHTAEASITWDPGAIRLRAYAGPVLFDVIALWYAAGIEVPGRPAKGIQEAGVPGQPTWTSD